MGFPGNGFAIVKDAVILSSEHGAIRDRFPQQCLGARVFTKYSPIAGRKPMSTEAKPDFAKLFLNVGDG